jgi:hypothetical protein
MSIFTASGAKLYIATTTALPANLAAYQALTWTEIGEVEDLGEFGDESEQVKFTALSDARTRNLKGPRDAGVMAIVVGDDMLDDGQIAMEVAEASPVDHNFKILLNDAVTVGGDNSEHYFRGKVFSKRRNVGNASNVVRRNFAVGINSAILSVDPS